MSFRSEPLKLCQMVVEKDAAFHCVVELGQQGVAQFIDLNTNMSVFQRTFVREVRRCTELERSIRYIESEIVDAHATKHIPPLDISNTDVPQQRNIYDLEAKIHDLERDIRQLLTSEAQLKRNYNDLREFQCVLEKVEAFFDVHLEHQAKTELETDVKDGVNDVGTPLTPLLEVHETPWFIAGVVDAHKRHSFERVLWRACRRTAFVRTAEINDQFEDPDTGKLVLKAVFIIFFNGRKLQDIVNRVCDGFNAKLYTCPKSSKDRKLIVADVMIRLHDLSVVIDTTERHKLEFLRGAAFELPEWVRTVHLQKCVYHTLNLFKFDTSGNFFVAECWIAERELDCVFQALQRGIEKSGSTISPIINIMETSQTPPTFNRTNNFTRVFQDIVDSYGIATYQEINPAPFTIITFPFLFGVMFGDLGHGLIMTLAGLAFIYYERRINTLKIKDEIFNTFFGGRFIIVLMGLFSMYAGLIYNDIFAKSVNVFGSRWTIPYNESELLQSSLHGGYRELDPANSFVDPSGPYLIGVDPIWNIANNRLNFLNSMKMKASVIIGIAQMILGVMLSFINAGFFGSIVDIFTQSIPQLIFLCSIFAYLCVQIFAKWLVYWVKADHVFGYYYPEPTGSHCAPSLLIGLINMCMFKEREVGFVNENLVEKKNCHLSYWYPHQDMVEKFLVCIALLCVPIMLFGKPICRLFAKKKQRTIIENRRPRNISVRVRMGSIEEAELITEENGESRPLNWKEARKSESHPRPDHDPTEFGDLMVHQCIHTIEFVLGCISHTASYLRLWALSLAHAQLSEVLFHMVLVPAFKSQDPIWAAPMLFICFAMFSTLTVSVLVVMEGLSAFLHALRLHWLVDNEVEFQSKFYEGAGHSFMPLHFKTSLRKLCAESAYL
ncbi:V-type proton ATPase subunit a [Aphelenchoides besseyi]|nr:V-type proton ATPase subunit a [Aphelenchoides besseyi]